MQTTIIAEKPSVAREIAAIVGATHREEGFLSGNDYNVTWAFGHLVQLAMPEAYGITGFAREHLPILPERFILQPRQIKDGKEYKPDAGVVKQLGIIKKLFDAAERIIVATDAGREGELIFRYIFAHLYNKTEDDTKQIERLWISSLTDKAIREGLQHLRPISEYNSLYEAAKARSEADWLVGINASQALSVAAGRGTYSLGRVQTPTLAMICSRYRENKEFTPVPFWQIKAKVEKNGASFFVLGKERYDNKEVAGEIYALLGSEKRLTVKLAQKKEVSQEPPLLYDLTALQKEANSRHGFSAERTLSIAQKLYESKLITYPRTGSRYISADVLEEIPDLIGSLKSHPRLGGYAAAMNVHSLNTRCVDDKKVTDHHALLITENAATLSGEELTIYEMIAARMLEAFSPKCIKDATVLTLSLGDTLFEARGSVIREAGWRAVLGENGKAQEKADDEEGSESDETMTLPDVSEGETLPIASSEILEKQTKPKPLHTESSLLAAMESAGREIADETEREALKDCGIGTPATRAAIIETLFRRDYIRREKKSLVPTDKGLAVYDTVKEKMIADVSMTGSWESALANIEHGKLTSDTFREAIVNYTRQITTELLETAGTFSTAAGAASLPCPKCGQGTVRLYPKVAKCSDPECGLLIFRGCLNRQLTDEQLTDLLTKGKTSLIKGFKSKAGKHFDAALRLDADFKTVFEFPERKKKK